jgi:phage terminase large subunit GpA-like protein
LQKRFTGTKRHAAIQAGVEWLLGDLLQRAWRTTEDTDIFVERILVDTGYCYREIEAAIMRIRSPIVTPSKGVGITAKNKPIAEYIDKVGERRGQHWIYSKIGKRRYPVLRIDTNFWKTDIHDSFGMQIGDRGGLSLWGDSNKTHQMFAEHLASEKVVEVTACENKIYEWSENITGGDNHYFDCIVGCAAAASFIGIKKPHEQDQVTVKHRAKVYKPR